MAEVRTRKKKLSDRQKRIMKFISNFIEERHYPPTVRDIQFGCEVSSTSVVDYNLRILQREGHIKRTPEVSRSIELTGKYARKDNIINLPSREDIVSVPVLSSIAAGDPLHIPSSTSWKDEAMDTVDIPSSMIGGKTDVFAVKVKGESMIDALVGDGDLVIMEPTDQANEGDMVAAFLTDREEVTLKHFHMSNGMVTLRPANSTMEPIEAPAENVSVRGRVVGVVRTL